MRRLRKRSRTRRPPPRRGERVGADRAAAEARGRRRRPPSTRSCRARRRRGQEAVLALAQDKPGVRATEPGPEAAAAARPAGAGRARRSARTSRRASGPAIAARRIAVVRSTTSPPSCVAQRPPCAPARSSTSARSGERAPPGVVAAACRPTPSSQRRARGAWSSSLPRWERSAKPTGSPQRASLAVAEGDGDAPAVARLEPRARAASASRAIGLRATALAAPARGSRGSRAQHLAFGVVEGRRSRPRPRSAGRRRRS